MVHGWNASRRNLPIVTVDLWKVCSRICDISVPWMGNISPLVVKKAKQMMCPTTTRGMVFHENYCDMLSRSWAFAQWLLVVLIERSHLQCEVVDDMTILIWGKKG